ncbi:hypothetical protein QBC34DRAFT_452359 [Podospora aff. communis PSN243]|uniref:Cyclochlorotine biosynthesis protein O n=1 Tax=Podospora aff. communis PSN243 TaxID=3040156 RepID=A0AAV9G8A6_9PEZI|nr:hypothetical protein QBC34DRAFT_452359 [Podospora aff. communis PSN243]
MMDHEEGEHLLETCPPKLPPPQPAKKRERVLQLCIFLSVLANVILISLLLVSGSLCKEGRGESPVQGQYGDGFSTDLEPSRIASEVVLKDFTGGLGLDWDRQLVRVDGGHEYIGKPSREVDEAWGRLLEGILTFLRPRQYVDLDKDEMDMTGWTFQWPESGLFLTGLDVYHSLHCLNRLRQALHPEFYPVPSSQKDDIGHCINHIRQALQCHADLTPSRWTLDGSRIQLLTDTRHTCRNWDKIHAWAVAHRTRLGDIESWKNGSLVIADY